MAEVITFKWQPDHLYHQLYTRTIVNEKIIDEWYAYDFGSDSNGIILMQYTGLKDKNGVEIYEGDILSYFGFEYEVIFEESAFGWYEGGQFYAFAEMAIDEIAKTKIIGNRYENPELSEGNQ